MRMLIASVTQVKGDGCRGGTESVLKVKMFLVIQGLRVIAYERHG